MIGDSALWTDINAFAAFHARQQRLSLGDTFLIKREGRTVSNTFLAVYACILVDADGKDIQLVSKRLKRGKGTK